MNRKVVLLAALAASTAVASPAFAWTYVGTTSGGTAPAASTTGGSTSVPEPGMIGLFVSGLIGLGLARRKKRR